MDVALLLTYAITAFTISVLFFPVLIKLLTQWKLFDTPGEHKIHEQFTPSMGGICIVLGVVFTLFISFPFQEWIELKYFFIALAVMFITGLRDDILALDPLRKMLGQFLPVLILVIFGDTVLNSFYGALLDSWMFPSWLGWIITIFTILVLTNAYNLIDGLDGLAGTIALIALLFFSWWFFQTDHFYFSIIAIAFSGSIVAFLFFNWQPSRIFMGDTGALAIGLALTYLCIQFINLNYGLPADHTTRFQASISTAVCVLIIPIFDTLRVIILRLRKLQSPFRADKNHLHHQFLKLGFSHAKSVVALGLINLLFVALAWILRNKSDALILPIIIGICLIINQALKFARKKYAANGGKSSIS